MIAEINPAWFGVGLTAISFIILPFMGFIIKAFLDSQTRELKSDLSRIEIQTNQTNGTVIQLTKDVAMLQGAVFGGKALDPTK